MNLRAIVIFSVATLLAGCTTTYTYNGRQYQGEQAFVMAVDSSLTESLASIQPLTKPVSTKTLVFAIPSQQSVFEQSVANFVKIAGRAPSGEAEVIVRNLSASNYKGIRSFYEIVKRKNIYQEVTLLERITSTGDLQAGLNQDVLYWSEPQLGSGQWYYVTSKSGKQVFAFDRGGATMADRSNAFAQAVQVFAIRD